MTYRHTKAHNRLHAGAPPEARAVFRPKSDDGFFRESVKVSVGRYYDAAVDRIQAINVGELLATLLEELYPAGDMAILARYRVACKIERACVRPPAPFKGGLHIDMKRKVCVPDRGIPDFQCEPYPHTAENNYGLKPGIQEQDEYATDWDEYVAHHVKAKEQHDKFMLPPAAVDLVLRLCEIREEYADLQTRLAGFPAYVKVSAGRYPRWQEMEKKFPAFGDYMNDLRSQAEKRESEAGSGPALGDAVEKYVTSLRAITTGVPAEK